jgi:hypothetical protein
MSTLTSSSQSVDSAFSDKRQCVFCMEEIRVGATTCPHCRNNLVPLQILADKHVEFEARLAALEREVVALRTVDAETASTEGTPSAAPVELAGLSSKPDIAWPHMADNIFLGLVTLLVAHWLATTLPGSNRAIFRLVALGVAMPFGFRFERHARSGPTGQVLAALAFGSVGTIAIGTLDLALAGHAPPPFAAEDVVASVAAIALSHYAGSALAHKRQLREEVATAKLATEKTAGSDRIARTRMHLEPARIKTTAEAVKALYDAVAPLAASVAALWAAFGHILF